MGTLLVGLAHVEGGHPGLGAVGGAEEEGRHRKSSARTAALERLGLTTDDLLGRYVAAPGTGEWTLRIVVLDGGHRAVEWNGAKRTLSLRRWILFMSHSAPTGLHYDTHQLEANMLTICWWPSLAADCRMWVRRCSADRSRRQQDGARPFAQSGTWRRCDAWPSTRSGR